MKRKHILFLLLAILLLCALLLNRRPGYASVMEANWGITLPTAAQWQEVYTTDSGPSPHGDGWRYHVYAYGIEAPVAEMVPWSATEGEAIFHSSYSEEAECWLDALEVPENRRPDYTACAFWYDWQTDNSQIILCWDAGCSTLYVLESFI